MPVGHTKQKPAIKIDFYSILARESMVPLPLHDDVVKGFAFTTTTQAIESAVKNDWQIFEFRNIYWYTLTVRTFIASQGFEALDPKCTNKIELV